MMKFLFLGDEIKADTKDWEYICACTPITPPNEIYYSERQGSQATAALSHTVGTVGD